MGEHWHRTRIDEGWEIRDGLHALVAAIPDEMHEQRANADMVAAAPDVAEQRDRLVDAIQDERELLRSRLEELRAQCRQLVDRVVKDAGVLAAEAAMLHPEKVDAYPLAMSVRDLTEAQRHVASARLQMERMGTMLKAAGLRSNAGRRAPLAHGP